MCFEEWLWETAAAEISHLHSDNGIFTADMFCAVCKMKHQTQRFSEVGVKHQMLWLRGRFKQSFTWPEHSYIIFLSIGLNKAQMICHYGDLLSNMLPGYTIVSFRIAHQDKG
jgi:uncharacterized membrane protein